MHVLNSNASANYCGFIVCEMFMDMNASPASVPTGSPTVWHTLLCLALVLGFVKEGLGM